MILVVFMRDKKILQMSTHIQRVYHSYRPKAMQCMAFGIYGRMCIYLCMYYCMSSPVGYVSTPAKRVITPDQLNPCV